VNQADPGGGPVACSDLSRILVFAGGGEDHVSLADVSRSAFGGLANVSVDGQEGNDTLIGLGVGDSLQGGGGVDSLRGGDGRASLNPTRPRRGARRPGQGHGLGVRRRQRVPV
jgi:Ca2+-binding RTX toxin-like protein